MISDEELRAKLVATFKGELDEYMASLNPTLIELERSGMREDLLHDAFRTVHNLKGAAGAIGLATVQQIAHSMENMLGAARRKEMTLTQDGFDLCYQGVDLIQSMVESELVGGVVPVEVGTEYGQKVENYLQAATDGASSSSHARTAGGAAAQPPQAEAATIIAKPSQPMVGKRKGTAVSAGEMAEDVTVFGTVTEEIPTVTPREATAAGLQAQSIRIPLLKIDRLMSDVSELLVSKNQFQERVREINSLGDELAVAIKDWALFRVIKRKLARTDEDKDIDRFIDMLESHQARLKAMHVSVQSLASRSSNEGLHLDMSVSAVQREVQDLRMVPIDTIFEPLRRAARDQARKQNKSVFVDFKGGETELDRQLVEAIKDPIQHILRNSIDHGLEDPDVRLEAGKPAEGRVTLTAEQRGNQIVVEISDDGAGINLEAVKSKAISLGWFNERELDTFTNQEMLALLFRPAFSTSRRITETAGRGVGLDVVKTNVERLQGQVEVNTVLGRGTTFRITLPLTLSTLHVLLIRCAGQMLAIPVASVERTIRVRPERAFSVESHLAITLESRAVSLVRLDALLSLVQGDEPDEEMWTVLVLYHGGERLALVIDEIYGEQELVIKPLGKQLRRVRNISGGAVMGDGGVVLLLNPADLLRSARGERDMAPRVREKEGEAVRHRILVVDDSITTRTLEKNILESAGFEVILAKDGREGFELATSSGCELVIADIEMPGMNGFELTQKIKSDTELASLPVILVSSLDSPQFKARGAQAGADAYIVKGEFDQGHFLELVSGMIDV